MKIAKATGGLKLTLREAPISITTQHSPEPLNSHRFTSQEGVKRSATPPNFHQHPASPEPLNSIDKGLSASED
ncbi:MAG: hypothetical protein ABR555_09485 [Pyrinomonadaceae bacterium]